MNSIKPLPHLAAIRFRGLCARTHACICTHVHAGACTYMYVCARAPWCFLGTAGTEAGAESVWQLGGQQTELPAVLSRPSLGRSGKGPFFSVLAGLRD